LGQEKNGFKRRKYLLFGRIAFEKQKLAWSDMEIDIFVEILFIL